MCTAALIAHADGRLSLGVNRDELRSRGRALPPAIWQLDGVAVVSPRDSDAGGTWVAANDRGLSLVLLNHYQGRQGAAQTPLRSRGAVVVDLASSTSLQEARARIEALRGDLLAHTRPFVLGAAIAASGDRPAQALAALWDGCALHLSSLALPAVLVSALWHRAATETARRVELPDLQRAAAQGPSTQRTAQIQAWFSSHERTRSPRSVCMHRLLAQTVSHTWIDIDHAAVSMSYHDASPCRPAQSCVVSLPRIHAD